jgi:hypothetical protein
MIRKFRGQCKIRHSYSEHLGGRMSVAFRIEKADDYHFIDAANWTGVNFSSVVERGVRDGLNDLEYDLDLGIHIVLEEIDYSPIDSSEYSFYTAAKTAIESQASNIKSQHKNHLEKDPL